MSNKKKSSSPPLKPVAPTKEVGICIPNDEVKTIVDRLLWILEPEVLYDSDPHKSAEDALNRCRLRARDLLLQFIDLLPAGHSQKKMIDRALVKHNVLPMSIGISREGPGASSKAERSPRKSEILDQLSELLEGHEFLDTELN